MGTATVTQQTIVNNLRFPGQYFDQETLANYNLHRYYDPTTGRYISADPSGLAAGTNLYNYVGGNPVSRIDPYGLWEFVFNAGFHLPAFPLFGVSGGPSAGSSWKPGEGLSGASFNGVAGEAVVGSLADAGVNAGIGGLSSCKDGKPRSLNFGLGRYGGVQLKFKGNQFDGITIGIGVGVSLPVTVTLPAKQLPCLPLLGLGSFWQASWSRCSAMRRSVRVEGLSADWSAGPLDARSG
jgi:RHS repeat-associated protein